MRGDLCQLSCERTLVLFVRVTVVGSNPSIGFKNEGLNL